MLGIFCVAGRVVASPPGFHLVTRFAGPEIDAGGTTNAVAQMPDGTMQFGSRGLLSFDGERWSTTPLGHGYGIRSLDVGPDGKLWSAAINDIGWFERTSADWQYHSLIAKLPPEFSPLGVGWNVYATATGAIFVCEDKILQWDGATLKAWPMTITRKARGFKVGDRVFVQHRPTGLYEVTPAGPVLFLPASAITDSPIFLLEQHGAEWTIVNGDGIFRWDGRELQPVAGVDDAIFKRHPLTMVLRLPDGRLALGTARDGIMFLNADGKFEAEINELGAEERYITSLYLDREGGLWATSRSAIYRVAVSSASRVLDARSGLAGQQLVQIGKDENGIALLTSDSFYRLTADRRGVASVPMPATAIFADIQAADRGLLVGGYRRLFRVVGNTVEVVHQTPVDVNLISRPFAGVQFFSDGRDIAAVDADNHVRFVHRGLPDFPTSLDVDAHGRLWLGTEASGVWCLEQGQAHALGAADGLLAIAGQTRAAVTADGTIVVFSPTGIWFRRDGRARFEKIDGFPSGWSVTMRPAPDSAGNLWIVAESADARQHSVGRISFAAPHPRWEPHSVEGLVQIGAPRCIFLETDAPVPALWIGGTAGVLRNELDRGAVAPQPAPPLLHVLARNAAGAAAPVAAKLPYSTQSIDFEFAAPEFAHRPLLRLETRIDGIDHDWIAAGRDSRRQLTALRDGDYTFRVRAVAETGVASAPTVFAFTVAPPWWRTVPALLGVIFALVPVGYGVYRLRLQALHRRTLELETKVRQRTEQLEQANAAKTQFVANMSHDIRNPLNGIVGLALALEDTHLDPKQREIVATLRECTTYLSSLVDDVLDFASIEAGRVELRPGPFVPGELLGSIVTTTKTDTAESGARLLVDVDPALPKILSGDAGRIQQILVNYVSNALKYAGGTIHLTATIPLGSPDEVEFAVADEGPGISAAEQATLFTKFTRLSGARDHEIPGAGLGLAACRLLADIMGGSVGVVSEPGHGARFFLRLPLTRAEVPVPPADGELPNTTVLLVEDTDYNALAASAVLARLGLTCERARTGEEALQLFAAKRYNLVLLDRNLPDMDGTEIARKMRAIESDGLRSILLAVTAYCTAEDRKLCLDAGMDAFVGKPLTPEKLRKVLLAAGRRMLAAATFEVTPEVATAPTGDVDMSLLNYISDGAEGGLDAQVDRFLASLAEHQAQLVRAAGAPDLADVGVAAHRILGQARMVGAANLTRAATELQEAAHAADAARCAELQSTVRAEIAALTAALRHRRSGALTS